MTFQCTLNTRLKKIAVVAAKSKQYSPFTESRSNYTIYDLSQWICSSETISMIVDQCAMIA